MRLNAKELIADARVTAPTLLPAASKLMTEMAYRLDVQFAALCESREQVKQLTAEIAGLRNFIIRDCYVAHVEPETFYETEVTRYVSADGYEPESLVADTLLASLHAEGVELAIKEVFSMDTVASTGAMKFVLQQFAAQLRCQSAPSPESIQSEQLKGNAGESQ